MFLDLIKRVRGGLMVSVLDSGASGPGASSSREDTALTMPLSTQVYK